MKAVFPCSYYLPETAASLYLTDNIIHACAEQDLEVDLYTPTPTRAVPEGAKWKRYETELETGDGALSAAGGAGELRRGARGV